MLIDANLLLYAHDRASRRHAAARAWLTEQLDGPALVGIPWPSLLAFVRVITHPRVTQRPLSATEAWDQVEDWLAAGPTWTPAPTERHHEVLGGLIARYELRGNAIPDAHLAALAIEHGLVVCSADTDFARFSEVRWLDPTAT